MKNKTITMYELIGLIKDDKAPKKVKYNNELYYFNGKDYIPENGFWLSTILNNYTFKELIELKVEILPEENDEWEDIDPLQEEGDFKFYNKPTGMSEEIAKILDHYFETLTIKINQLIKNQKYLKERIEYIVEEERVKVKRYIDEKLEEK